MTVPFRSVMLSKNRRRDLLPMKTTLTQPLYSLPYSLHDGYLTKLEADEETLICHFPDGIFSTTAPYEQTTGAKVIFTGVDWDCSFLYVFDGLKNTGAFSGKKWDLKAFLPYWERLEVIDETYGYWQAKWKGLLTKGEEMVECMVEVCYSGEMVYEIEE